MKNAFLPRLFYGLVLLSLSSTTSVRAADPELSGEDVYKRALKSTVWIVIIDGERAKMGSGSLIDVKQRLILTNHHVIMGKDTCLVQFPMLDNKGNLISEKSKYYEQIKSKGAIQGKVLFSEKTKDLAIVQLASLPKGVEAFQMADNTPGSAAKVHSVGNPGASDALFVYTPGEVRTSYVKTWTAGGGSTVLDIKAKIIEATSPTSPGDSGGPLLDKRAHLVGVTQGGLSDPKATGYSYFIDVSEVKAMLVEHKIKVTGATSAEVVINTEPTTEPKTEPKVEPKTKEPKVEPKKETSLAADEKNAESLLGRIQTLADQGKKDLAIQRLEELLKKYPNTGAAKDAKELMKKLK